LRRRVGFAHRSAVDRLVQACGSGLIDAARDSNFVEPGERAQVIVIVVDFCGKHRFHEGTVRRIDQPGESANDLNRDKAAAE
jgi:hypothetical protein